jgi:hypothetical protein
MGNRRQGNFGEGNCFTKNECLLCKKTCKKAQTNNLKLKEFYNKSLAELQMNHYFVPIAAFLQLQPLISQVKSD